MVIILVVFIVIYKQRNKNLLANVNKISFAQSGVNEKDNDSGNLLLNDD